MATPSNHWKLGLFVVTGVIVGLGTVVALGARNMSGMERSIARVLSGSAPSMR